MSHTIEEKKKLLNRVRRIMGQVASIEKALDQETAECSEILHNISACRGAMDALMAEVIEGHIRFHILPGNGTATDEQTKAAGDLVRALHAYLN
ncbi:MAG: metal/formaldehyde-sensitive transcriptional repressor [Bryobacteraceae bacterium]